MCDRNAESEQGGDRSPTLYLVLDPDQDPSSSSEVRMLVGTREELCGHKTGGGDVVLEKGVLVPYVPAEDSTARSWGPGWVTCTDCSAHQRGKPWIE